LGSEFLTKYLISYFYDKQNLELKNLVQNERSKELCKNLFEIGHSIVPDKDVLKLREELGLPKIPPTVLSSKKALLNFQKLLRKMRFYINGIE